MRLVLTGGSGFIGRNVLLRAPRDWDITAVYNQTSTLPAFIDEGGLTHVRSVRCDLTDMDQVRRLGSELGRVDAALYLAANGDPARSADDPAWDLGSNAMSLVNFLECCPVDHLVYLSSGAVYDGLTGAVSPESAVSRPCRTLSRSWPRSPTSGSSRKDVSRPVVSRTSASLARMAHTSRHGRSPHVGLPR